MAASSEPRRSPPSVRMSSRLARVAWSMASVAPAASRTGGDSGGPLADLGALDMVTRGGRGGQLDARERAERRRGRDAEETRPAAARLVAPSNTSRVSGRHRRQRAQIGRKLGVRKKLRQQR